MNGQRSSFGLQLMAMAALWSGVASASPSLAGSPSPRAPLPAETAPMFAPSPSPPACQAEAELPLPFPGPQDSITVAPLTPAPCTAECPTAPIITGPLLPPPPGCPLAPEAPLMAPCPLDPPPPVVKLRVRVPACAPAGADLIYRITVENCAPGDAHHVIVRNPLPSNAKFVRANPEPSQQGKELLWKLGTMHGGEVRIIELVLAPTGSGDIANCARVQFEHGQCVTTRIAGAAPLPPEGPPPEVMPPDKEKLPKEKPPKEKPKAEEPKLIMSMSGPKQQSINQPAQYVITIANAGKAPAENVTIRNDIPDGMKFVRAEQGGKISGNQVTWQLGKLEPEATKTVEIVLQASAPGKICNKARASADGDVKADAEFCTVFVGASALLLEMVDRKDPIKVGDDTSYSIVVLNQGNIPVTNIRIKALIPEALVPTRAKGPVDPPKNLPDKVVDGYQVLQFDPLPNLAAGAQVEYEVFVTAGKAGDVRFKVEMTADQLTSGMVYETESTNIYSDEGEGAQPPAFEAKLLRPEGS